MPALRPAHLMAMNSHFRSSVAEWEESASGGHSPAVIHLSALFHEMHAFCKVKKAGHGEMGKTVARRAGESDEN